MKKLTAGILASLIGLVSANSADAAVASKAYVDGAIETLDVAKVGTDAVTSFVKTVSETDGKISATAGDLADIVIGGTNVTVTKNATGQLVVDGHAADGNTQYTFTDTDTVTFDESTDANGNVTVTATANIELDGNTQYEGVKDVAIVADTDNDGLQEVYTEYYDASNVDGKNSTEEGWYVLMRKADPNQPNGYKYQWELLDRSYNATDLDVEHNEGTQPAQQ
jgi:hypothetical protein